MGGRRKQDRQNAKMAAKKLPLSDMRVPVGPSYRIMFIKGNKGPVVFFGAADTGLKGRTHIGVYVNAWTREGKVLAGVPKGREQLREIPGGLVHWEDLVSIRPIAELLLCEEEVRWVTLTEDEFRTLLLNAALREFREETGLLPETVRVTKVDPHVRSAVTYPADRWRGFERHSVRYMVDAELVDDEKSLHPSYMAEWDRIYFVPPDEVQTV